MRLNWPAKFGFLNGNGNNNINDKKTMANGNVNINDLNFTD